MEGVEKCVALGTPVHVPHPMQHSTEYPGAKSIPGLFPQHGNKKWTLASNFLACIEAAQGTDFCLARLGLA